MTTFLDKWRIEKAVSVLKAGGVIAYPTEGVYGLGCDPSNFAAVERILTIKQRTMEKGLVLIASSWDQVSSYVADLPPETLAKIQKSWPGPITWLFPAKDNVPLWIVGSYDTVALRVTNHPLAAALCKAYGGAIVSTSANVTNQMPLRHYQQVKRQFGSQIDFILEGRVGNLTKPTQIWDAKTGRNIRG